MGVFGKWIGGGLGFALGGPLGAILGFLIGLMVDSTTIQVSRTSSTRRPTAGDFCVSFLVLIAAMMKADGKVLKSELDYVKRFLVGQFGEASAKEALLLLRDIIRQDIPVRDVCVQIRQNMDYSSRLQLVHLLFNVAIADGTVNVAELETLGKISGYLGINSSDFLSLKNMFVPETDSAYKILEIDPAATDDDVKKAYRKMAMKYHPDKVAHLGEEFRKPAEEKFRKVNEAYEKIKMERNMN